MKKYVIEEHNLNKYSTKILYLPKLRFICFYNGADEQTEEQILNLSDLFKKEGDIAVSDTDVKVRVKMLNINYGKNKKLLKMCKTLHEYSWLINKAIQYIKTLKKLEEAFDVALDEMPMDFVIRKFLFKHKAEVKGMFLTEYNEEKLRSI